MKSIAITGATGFIGGSLARYFARKGHPIIALGRRATKPTNLAEVTTYISWDIGAEISPPELANLLAKNLNKPNEPIDVVIHCAGSVTDWGNDAEMFKINVTGTKNVLQAFAQAGQFIHLSSASIYDPGKPKFSIGEDIVYPEKYLNAYGRTKMLAEVAVKESTNKNRVIVRPHIVYGPHDTTVLPRLLRARRLGHLPLIGNGENHLSLTYLANLCQAIELIMENEFSCEVFNIADERTDTMNNIVGTFLETLKLDEKIIHLDKHLAMLLGKVMETSYTCLGVKSPPLLSSYIMSQMSVEYTLDISKAQKILGYRPQYDYKKGFEEIKRWLDAEKSLGCSPC